MSDTDTGHLNHFSAIKPTQNNVLVRRLDSESMEGRVRLPDDSVNPIKLIYEVLAVGPGSLDLNGKLHPCGVSVGDYVILGVRMRGEAGLHFDGYPAGIVPEATIACIVETRDPLPPAKTLNAAPLERIAPRRIN